MEALVKIVGWTTFLKLCTFPLSSADQYMTPEEQATVMETKRGGTRKMKFRER